MLSKKNSGMLRVQFAKALPSLMEQLSKSRLPRRLLSLVAFVVCRFDATINAISHLANDEPYDDARTLLLLRAEALIERLPRVDELLEFSATLGERIGAVAQELDGINLVIRRYRESARSRMACSTAGHSLTCSGVSRSAPLSMSIRASVKTFMSAWLIRDLEASSP
jgi:hypothetical protein